MISKNSSFKPVVKVLMELRRKNASFAFSGCGWLVPFHLGVIKKMKEENILTRESICSGTSGGALAALIAVNEIDPEKALGYIIDNSLDKSFRKNIHSNLRQFLKTILPEDALKRSNNRLYICVTKIWPNPKNAPVIISKYKSIDELLDVISASCFIPLYSNPRMIATKLQLPQNQQLHGFFIDGGLHAWMPPVGDIRVSPINPYAMIWRPKPHITIDKAIYPLSQLMFWTVNPPKPVVLQQLYQIGYDSAEQYLHEQQQQQQQKYLNHTINKASSTSVNIVSADVTSTTHSDVVISKQ